MLHLRDAVETACVVHSNRQAGLKMRNFPLQHARVFGRANNLQRRKERIKRQPAAGQEVLAAELQATDLRLLGHVVDNSVERNHDQLITARQGEVAHVSLMESW